MHKPSRAILLWLSVAGLSACTHYDDYAYGYGPGHAGYADPFGGYGYEGDYYAGYGAEGLDPWLAGTPEGREIVARGFGGGDGRVSEEAAWRANAWFRRYADTNADMRLTDEEIRLALVQGSRDRPWMRNRGY